MLVECPPVKCKLQQRKSNFFRLFCVTVMLIKIFIIAQVLILKNICVPLVWNTGKKTHNVELPGRLKA